MSAPTNDDRGSHRCTGVILAGGGATRYSGRAKGLERVGGKRILDRVVQALRPVTDDLIMIANDSNARSWLPGVRVGSDLRVGDGALGGLHAALAHAERLADGSEGAARSTAGGSILLVAWDMPFVNSALLAALRERGERGDVDAVLPESDGSPRGVEPLCAWYSSRCLPAVTAALEAGDRRVIAFHDAVRTVRLGLEEVATFGDPAKMFANVNTPEELAWADKVAREKPGPRRD